MKRALITSLLTIALAVAPAAASELDLKVQTVAGVGITTVNTTCTTVRYMITGQLSDTLNDGLALWAADLELTGPATGTLTPLSRPPVFSDLAAFDIPLGITNPSAAGGNGYGGTPAPGQSNKLLQIGGAVNTIHNDGALAPFPDSTTVLENYAQARRVLAVGTVTLPSTAGTYTLAITNAVANIIRDNEPSDPEYHRTERAGSITTSDLVIQVVATPTVSGLLEQVNPPLAADNVHRPGLPFRDVLENTEFDLTPRGIGAAGTPDEGPVHYSTIVATFSCPPLPAPDTTNVIVSCTGGNCPFVTNVAQGSSANEYIVTLSGPIPPKHCTSITFDDVKKRVQYQVLPGDVDLNGISNTQDLMALNNALNAGIANDPANRARYDIDRNGVANTLDLLRLNQLLNGQGTTEIWNQKTVAACP